MRTVLLMRPGRPAQAPTGGRRTLGGPLPGPSSLLLGEGGPLRRNEATVTAAPTSESLLARLTCDRQASGGRGGATFAAA
jgi:hypothetical protein